MKPIPHITAPNSPRLSDWFGVWAHEPERFGAMWRLLSNTDLVAHANRAQFAARKSTVEMVAGNRGQSVALVKIAGQMMKSESSFGGTSTVQVRRDIRAAVADPNVSGILLAIDSPGGTVAGTADLAADVQAARRVKPVWAHIDDLGASAAYWVASQADAVYANNDTALIGSIGTMAVVYDFSRAAEAEGVEAIVFATGPLKAAGVPGAPVTDEQKAYFQALIDDSQISFDWAVKSGRGLSDSQLAAVRTGEVFGAQKAKSLRLIDGIQSLDTTLTNLLNSK